MSPTRHEAAQALHTRIGGWLSRQREVDYELCRDLHEMNVARLFTELGCASLYEYGQRYHRLTPDQTRTFITIGNRIQVVPGLGEALKTGRIGKTVAKTLAKVVTSKNLRDWLGFTEAASSREVEELVRHAALGDSVETARRREEEADPLRRLVVSDVPQAVWELAHRAFGVERERAGLTRDECSDADALLRILQAHMERVIQDHDHDVPDTACRYMKVVHVDEENRPLEGYGFVDETDHAMSDCDSHVFDMTDGPGRGTVTSNIPAATRRVVFLRDAYRCCVGGCDNWIYLDVHHIVPRGDGGNHNEGNLMTLCGAHHRLHHSGGLAIAHDEPGSARIETRTKHVTRVDVQGRRERRRRASRDAEAAIGTAEPEGRRDDQAVNHGGLEGASRDADADPRKPPVP